MAVGLMADRLMSSLGKDAVIWINRLRFEVKIIRVDDEYVEYYDLHKFKTKVIKISEIEEAEVK